MKVLYVEDDSNQREIASVFFRGSKLPFTLDTSDGVVNAMEEIARKDYDIIVTDIMMPEFDGVELSKLLAISRPNIPVYLCTALEDLYRFEDYKGNGNIKGFIKKPLTPEGLALAHPIRNKVI